jgi:hypothetical protein
MSLQDLVGRNLDRIEPAADTVKRLLDGSTRHIADSKIAAVSAETRFVSAYTAVRMLADIGLNASGFRTRSSVPGHHIVAIQALAETLGIEERVIARLDHLRKLRNAAEYSGDIIPESAVAECVTQAEALHTRTLNWLRKHKPELLKTGR